MPEQQAVKLGSGTDAGVWCFMVLIIGVPMSTCFTGIALRFVAFLFGMG